MGSYTSRQKQCVAATALTKQFVARAMLLPAGSVEFEDHILGQCEHHLGILHNFDYTTAKRPFGTCPPGVIPMTT
jgi:hypothetical protein